MSMEMIERVGWYSFSSIVPDPVFKRGADVVGGVIVTDADKVMRIVAEGGGTPQLRAAVRLVTMKPKSVRIERLLKKRAD
jgi:hypothetical protein